MLKSYQEMRKVDVRPYCEEREGKIYLNWAKCLDLLHENGAERAYWEPIPDPATGSSLRMVPQVFTDSKSGTNRCYETRIKVVIDDKEYEMQSPVLNGVNPVKDNSMNQLRVWNSMCRSFVKCVAIHTGLGFDLWLKEEMNPFSNQVPEEEQKPSTAQVKVLKELAARHKVNLEYWIASNNKTWDTLTARDAGQMLSAMRQKYGEDGDGVYPERGQEGK